MGLFSRKTVDVHSPAVVAASRSSDAQVLKFIQGLPTSIEPVPTRGVFRTNPARWEVHVRACRELHAFAHDVLDTAQETPTPDRITESWADDLVTAFGQAVTQCARDVTRSPDYRLMAEQGGPVDGPALANLITPAVVSALGGIGKPDPAETRVHEVADALMLKGVLGCYLGEDAGSSRSPEAAFGFGWTWCAWVDWSDSHGLVTAPS